uniref:Uncharacterized protein n=1 Tax=Populus trichocarpa TaxID=3694 RepID=A0A2K2A7S0_POPTR
MDSKDILCSINISRDDLASLHTLSFGKGKKSLSLFVLIQQATNESNYLLSIVLLRNAKNNSYCLLET